MPNTTNHGVNLPTVNSDPDTWGTENNAAHQSWDTLLSGAQYTLLGRVASGSGAYTQLTGAQVISALPLFSTSANGVAPQSTTAEANRPLVGGGTYKKGIGRAAGALITVTGSSATLVAGSLNVASITWADVDGTYATVAVVFSTALPSADYQVVAGSEAAAGTAVNPGSVVAGTRTVNGFTFTYAKLASLITLSVFEAQ